MATVIKSRIAMPSSVQMPVCASASFKEANAIQLSRFNELLFDFSQAIVAHRASFRGLVRLDEVFTSGRCESAPPAILDACS
jgi:hypothetical protein